MKIFCATWLEDNRGQAFNTAQYINRLLSYYYLLTHQGDPDGIVREYVERGCIDDGDGVTLPKGVRTNLFIDSGAFSAHVKGVTISLQEYCKFLQTNHDHISIYANLDIVGDAKGTWQNQKKMEQQGLAPLPCFHYGEDWKYLKRYIDQYGYIALGGMVPIASKDLAPWLNICFSQYICDSKGMPRVKVHGFGLTTLWLMLRYPWFSVDSTSWVNNSRMGSIPIPRSKSSHDLAPDYLKPPLNISISNASPGVKQLDQHLDTLPQAQREWALAYIKQEGFELGKSKYKKVNSDYKLKPRERWANKQHTRVEMIVEPGLANHYLPRDIFNISYYKHMEQAMPKWPWAYRPKETTFSSMLGRR